MAKGIAKIILGMALSLALSAAASATDTAKFTAKALADAQAAGKSVLVEVTAPWCPTCKAQRPILDSLFQKPEFKNLVVLNMDFDTQKDDLRALNVRNQSTLVVFKGAAETGRSTGDTKAESIAALLAKAL